MIDLISARFAVGKFVRKFSITLLLLLRHESQCNYNLYYLENTVGTVGVPLYMCAVLTSSFYGHRFNDVYIHFQSRASGVHLDNCKLSLKLVRVTSLMGERKIT